MGTKKAAVLPPELKIRSFPILGVSGGIRVFGGGACLAISKCRGGNANLASHPGPTLPRITVTPVLPRTGIPADPLQNTKLLRNRSLYIELRSQ